MTALAHPLESTPFAAPAHSGPRPREIILLGTGPAHIELLSHLAKHPLVGATVTLIASNTHQVAPQMVADWVAGHTPLQDCSIDLEPLVQRAGVRWLRCNVVALDVHGNTVQLEDSTVVRFDLLSVNTGLLHSRAAVETALPGAREHALFALPAEAFSVLWPQAADLGRQRAMRIAVIGDSCYAISLTMAVRHVLPNAAVTLVAGLQGISHYVPAVMQARVIRALKQRQITVLQDTATSLNSNAVTLGCGAALACDIPLYAGAAQAAHWVKDSGLATDEQSFIAIDACRRSVSHPHIWTMDSADSLSGDDVASGTTLVANVVAAVAGSALHPFSPSAGQPYRKLQTLGCGERYAIGAWGSVVFEGYWVWWLQQRMHRKTRKHLLA